MFPSWLSSLVKVANQHGKRSRRDRTKPSRPRTSFRPALEQFEDRLVPTGLDHFVVSPATFTPTAGVLFHVTVTADDSGGNPVIPSPAAQVTLSSSVAGQFSQTVSFSGVSSFTYNVTLTQSGAQILSASDTNGHITPAPPTVTVQPGSLNHLAVSPSNPNPTPGGAFYVTVTAQDVYNNTVTGYANTVMLMSTDTGVGATGTQQHTYVAGDNGSYVFSVTMVTIGSQNLNAVDNQNYVGNATVMVQQATPVISLTDNSGPFTNTPFMATASIHGTIAGVDTTPSSSLQGVPLVVTYYSGPIVSGPAIPAPTNIGQYTVQAAFAGSTSYLAASTSVTFTISPATPTVTVTDAGGTYSGSTFPATATVAGVSGVPGPSLETVSPALTYYYPMAITNSSFQSPVQTLGGSSAGISGWTLSSGNDGVMNYTTTQFPSVGPLGYQAGFLSSTGGEVYFQGFGFPYVSGNVYTFSVLAGIRADDASLLPTTTISIQDNVGNTLATTTFSDASFASHGVFKLFTVSYTCTPAEASRSIRVDISRPAASGAQLVISDVTLDGNANASAPSATGAYSVTAAFPGSANYTSASASTSFNINPIVSPSVMPAATEGIPFSLQLSQVDAGSTHTIYTLAPGSNSLPAWLSLNPTTGVLSGTPLLANDGTTSTFTVMTIDNALSVSGTQSYSLTVNHTLYVSQHWTLVTPTNNANPIDGAIVSSTEFGGTVTAIYDQNAFGIVSGYSALSNYPNIQNALNAVVTGQTIKVGPGTYAENDTITTASITILGAKAGVNPNTSRFSAFTTTLAVNGPKASPAIETVLTVPSVDPTGGSAPYNDIFLVNASNVTLDGFVFDGNNPSLGAGGAITSGGGSVVNVDGEDAVTNFDSGGTAVPISGLQVLNSVVQNFGTSGITLDDAGNSPATNGLIQNNVFSNNVQLSVILYHDAYTDIKNNTILVPAINASVGANAGIQLQSFSHTGSMTWSGNGITVGQDGTGIFVNLYFGQPNSSLTISGNTVNPASGATPGDSSGFTWGIEVASVQDSVTVAVTNNTIGNVAGGLLDRGMDFWNLPTSNTVTVSGGTIANSRVGIELDNVDPFFGGVSANSTLNVSGVAITAVTGSTDGIVADVEPSTFTPAPPNNLPSGNVTLNLSGGSIAGSSVAGFVGVLVEAPTNAGSYTAQAQFSGAASITGGATGIKVNGAFATISVSGASPLSLSGQSGDYLTLAGTAFAAPAPVGFAVATFDASTVSFGGFVPGTGTVPANLASFYALEDKITDYLDDGTLGYVNLLTGKLFVTQKSENTNAGVLQRAANQAAAGNQINVSAGTFPENVIVGTSVTFKGAQAGMSSTTRFNAFPAPGVIAPSVNGPKADPTVETVITAPRVDPTGASAPFNDLFLVNADNVTFDGFVMDGNNPLLSTTGSIQSGSSTVPIDGEDAITNYNAAGNQVVIKDLQVLNTIVQSFGYSAITLDNGPSGPAPAVNNLIKADYFTNNAQQAVLLLDNAFTDVQNNTVVVPAFATTVSPNNGNTGIQLGAFNVAGTMTWSGNNVTVGQDGTGIYVNQFYSSTETLNIGTNTVNPANGATTGDANGITIGIEVISVGDSTTVSETSNIVGNQTGLGTGTFDRGLDFYYITSPNVSVSGGTIGDSRVGVELDNVDPIFGSVGADSTVSVSGVAITGGSIGVYANDAILSPNTFGAANNVVAGSVTLNVSGGSITGATTDVLVNSPTSSAPFFAKSTINGGLNVSGGGTTGVLIQGTQAVGIISNVIISDPPTGVDIFGTASITGSNLSGNNTGIVVENGGTLTTATNNLLNGNSVAGVQIDATGSVGVPGIEDNNLSSDGIGVANSSGVAVDASENWWGVSNLEASVAAQSTGLIDYTPWLDNGTNHALVGNGFTGDLTKLDVGSGGQQIQVGGRINEAIGDLTAGGTIKVFGAVGGPTGIYNENVNITKVLTLVSVSGASLTTINDVSGGVGGTVRVAASVNGAVIGGVGQGFTINATNSATVWALNIAGTGATVTGNTFVASATPGVAPPTQQKGNVVVADASNTITGNTFTAPTAAVSINFLQYQDNAAGRDTGTEISSVYANNSFNRAVTDSNTVTGAIRKIWANIGAAVSNASAVANDFVNILPGTTATYTEPTVTVPSGITIAPGGKGSVTQITLNLATTGLVFAAGSAIQFDVNSPYTTAGTDYDQIIAGGKIDLTGATVSVTIGASATSPAGRLTLISNPANTTTASTVTVAGTIFTLGGQGMAITYAGGSSGNDVALLFSTKITWSNPANITYQTALSGTQLNATFSVIVSGVSYVMPGTPVYTVVAGGAPASGAILNAGNNQGLQVSFTPNPSAPIPDTNPLDYYSPVTKTVQINVLTASLSIFAVTYTKTYDGTNTATPIPTFTGLQPGDTLNGLTETFANKNVGTNLTLSVATYTLSDPSNYTVTLVPITTGEIDPHALSITANTFTKTYDGTTSASVAPTVAGLQPGDSFSTGPIETYDTKFVGTGKTLSVTSYVISDTNGGNNYTVSLFSDHTGEIDAGPLNGFQVTAASPQVSDGQFIFTVTAVDSFGNTVASYNGKLSFTDTYTDVGVGVTDFLPGNSFVNNGVGYFVAALHTQGHWTITATDTTTMSLTGTSGSILVGPAPGTVVGFTVSASPNPVIAGNPFVVVVKAVDSNGLTVTTDNDTVHFTALGDPLVSAGNGLPADGSLVNGVGFFASVLKTSGPQTLTATDTSTSAIFGSTNVTVNAGAVTHFSVIPAASVTGVGHNAVTNTAFNFTVAALDPFGNANPGYTGTVHFTSSDAAVAAGSGLPSNYTFTGVGGDNGTHTFSATLKTPGSQTLTATDTNTPSITGTSNAIAVRGLVVSSLVLTPTGFVANFNKAINPASLDLYYVTVGGVPSLTPDVILQGPVGPPVRGSIVVDPSNTFFTFVQTATPAGVTPAVNVLAPGNYTVTILSGASGLLDGSGGQLDGAGNGTTANYVANFTVATSGISNATTIVIPSAALILGMPDFARGPDGTGNNIQIPQSSTPQSSTKGLPITLTNPGGSIAGVTHVTFTVSYNQTLLNISGLLAGSPFSTATVTFNVVDATHETASFTFDNGGTSINIASGGVLTLGQIVANVPDSALTRTTGYKAKQDLHLGTIVVTGQTAVGDDAVAVNAYFGDVQGTGSYSGGDASLISRVALGTDSGFNAFRLLDPAIVGDLNSNGQVDSTDATLMNRLLAGFTVTQVPPRPPGAITATGPDPVLSLPTDIQAAPGSTVVVPVNIDTAKPDGSTGMMDAMLALTYDPRVFSVSAADVQLGSLPDEGSGWQIKTAINSQTGEIGIDLFSMTPIDVMSGGSLVTIELHLRDGAPAGATGLNLVNQVNPTGQRVFQTMVSDSEGAFVLHPAVTAAGVEPGTPGQVTVSSLTAAVNTLTVVALPSEQGMASQPVLAAAVHTEREAFDGGATALSMHLVEQVFGALEQAGLAEQENTLGQPGPLFNSQLTEEAAESMEMLAAGNASIGQWDDCLANLATTAVRGRAAVAANLLDGLASDPENVDLDGLEAFFAREVSGH